MTPQQVADLHEVCRLLWQAFEDDRLNRTPGPDNVDWIDGPPPPTKSTAINGQWARKALENLQRRPGRWAAARVSDTKGEAMHHARALRQLGAQATTRSEERGWVVYASWPGEAA